MEFNNPHYIEQLLAKYFEAETTAEEETVLQQYFNGDQVAPHLQQYSAMFQYFAQAKEETYTGNVPLTPMKSKKSFNYKRWISVAAVAVLFFGVFYSVDPFSNSEAQLTAQEQQEAQEAYEQTKKAFELLAMNLEKGKQQLTYLNEFEATKQKVFNN